MYRSYHKGNEKALRKLAFLCVMETENLSGTPIYGLYRYVRLRSRERSKICFLCACFKHLKLKTK